MLTIISNSIIKLFYQIHLNFIFLLTNLQKDDFNKLLGKLLSKLRQHYLYNLDKRFIFMNKRCFYFFCVCVRACVYVCSLSSSFFLSFFYLNLFTFDECSNISYKFIKKKFIKKILYISSSSFFLCSNR